MPPTERQPGQSVESGASLTVEGVVQPFDGGSLVILHECRQLDSGPSLAESTCDILNILQNDGGRGGKSLRRLLED